MKFKLIFFITIFSFLFSYAQNLPIVEINGKKFYYHDVKKGESIYGISKLYNWQLDTLRSFNKDNLILKKGTRLYYPVVMEVGDYIDNTAVENSSTFDIDNTDFLEEIEENQISITENIVPVSQGIVKMALILEDPLSRKDLEMSRGLLISLNNHKNDAGKIDFKIFNGKHSTDSVLTALKEYNANIIVSTSDNLPDYLLNFALDNKIFLMNSFDVRSKANQENPFVINYNASSNILNNATTNYILDRYKNRKFIFINRTGNDEIGDKIFNNVNSSQKLELSLDEIKDYPFYVNEDYLIYCDLNDKKQITELLDILYEKKLENVLIEMDIVGKPNWIIFADQIDDKFNRLNVLIPSRFYFDTSTPEGKTFMNEYKEMFNHPPYRSYPLFCVAGYDLGNYLFDVVKQNNGDFSNFSNSLLNKELLQTDIDFIRRAPQYGLENISCYILKYNPGFVEKINIKNYR